jgi:hypothetical protein
MGKETIEEAALRNCKIITHTYYLMEKKLMFIAGAKSEAARDYWFKIFKEQSEKN